MSTALHTFATLITKAECQLPTSQLEIIKRKRTLCYQMSQPHAIRTREEHSTTQSSTSTSRLHPRCCMQRCHSAPNLRSHSNTFFFNHIVFQVGSAYAGDLAIQHGEYSCEEDGYSSDDSYSLDDMDSVSHLHSIFDKSFGDGSVYAEALWHHVIMDNAELGFRAGDVIKVTFMEDKDWWFGETDGRQGWFPSTFVRLLTNQTYNEGVDEGYDEVDGLENKRKKNLLCSDVTWQQPRENVVNEIIHAEREYVKHLNDIIEGYVEKAAKRPEMFPEDRLSRIFGNLGEILHLSKQLLLDLEKKYQRQNPSSSQFGQVFLKHKRKFEIYSKYCNNHPQAHEELRTLKRNKKFQQFFEACRLLQQMIQIPLEGFLITPVQKICKYPLQLAELLKYTPRDHSDYDTLKAALACMKESAVLINERKRKMESLQKLRKWKDGVLDWVGEDLLERSSELIHCGDMAKLNPAGWLQDRVFFLFDHQLVYCKKDLLRRDVLSYRGRIDMDDCDIVPIRDGKVRFALRIYDRRKEKWFTLCAADPRDKELWLQAFLKERKTVKADMDQGFCLAEYCEQISKIQSYAEMHSPSHKRKGKDGKRKVSDAIFALQPDLLRNLSTKHASLEARHTTLHPPSKQKWGWLRLNIWKTRNDEKQASQC